MQAEKDDDCEFHREIKRESDFSRLSHTEVLKFLNASMRRARSMKHTSIILITHTPSDHYIVDYAGNLAQDELVFGLEAAKINIMQSTRRK